MSKVTLTDLVNLQNEATAVASINANNAAIVAAIENTLSRNGTSPNQMSANLDMNSQKIINLPAPATSTEPVRLQDFQDLSLAAGSGNVTGVVSSTDMAIARFSGTSGRAIQNSGVTISDTNLLTTTTFATTGAATIGGTLGVTGATSLSTLSLSGNLSVTGTGSFSSTLSTVNINVAGNILPSAPPANIGGTGTPWSNLYLGNSGTINWNSGNVVLSNNSTTLTITGNVSASGSLKSTSSSLGVGYATGAGSTVTQTTSKTTGVTINTPSGQITTSNSAINSYATQTFTVTNSSVAATDTISMNWSSGGTVDAYRVDVSGVSAGSFKIRINNTTAGTLSEALVLNFNVIKGVTS